MTQLQPSTADASAPVVRLSGITKRFPGVVANDRIEMALLRGEVHCVLGENGAGKSTLMNILAGTYRPDEGRILIDGAEVAIESPRHALDLGIGMVYQHTTLVPSLTVLENLMLGSTGVRLDASGFRARLADIAERLGIGVDPDAEAGSLSLGQQQQVEIVKALWRGSRVLILDEPTSMLTPQGVADLAGLLQRLKEEGLAVVFITHKLHEAVEIGDRVTVLRQGRVAGAISPDELRGRAPHELQDAIVRMMFAGEGRAVADVAELREHVGGRAARRAVGDRVVLELIHVTVPGKHGEMEVADVSLAVREGEIFGLAGVDGNGQRELAEAIAGQRRPSAGEIRLGDRSITTMSVSRRQRLGLRYVTDDRLGEGTVGSLSVALNLVAKRIGQRPFWRRGTISRRAVHEHAGELVERFDVRTPSVLTRAGTLSGGNVQKVVLARELAFEPQVVVYSKPTYGLDVKTTQAVRERIRELADDGVAALVISTDLDELLELCDRIGVLSRGRLTGIVENGPGAEEKIGALMLGARAA